MGHGTGLTTPVRLSSAISCGVFLKEFRPQIFGFITRALSAAGLDVPVDTVNDGKAAVEFLTEAGKRAPRTDVPLPCLVLLDLNLPHRQDSTC